MIFKYNIVNQISSCFITTSNSSTICYIMLAQKIEQENTVKIIFNNEENELQNIISEIINKLVIPVDSITEIQIYFHVLKTGFDLFSNLINCFSVCALLGNIPLKDFIYSVSIKSDNRIGHMVYGQYQKKPFNLKLEGSFSDINSIYDELLEECKKQEKLIKLSVDTILQK